MANTEVQGYLAQMAAVQAQVLDALAGLPREEFRYETEQWRWNTVRRVLLRLGDHLREHTTQLVEAREAAAGPPTMTQRILAQAMEAYGYWLGAMVGLSDEDLDQAPAPGEWTPRQVLEHMISSQSGYLDTIQRAREARRPVERD
jgi:uncharacterized protein YukE